MFNWLKPLGAAKEGNFYNRLNLKGVLLKGITTFRPCPDLGFVANFGANAIP
jgi:hypothetical protein